MLRCDLCCYFDGFLSFVGMHYIPIVFERERVHLFSSYLKERQSLSKELRIEEAAPKEREREREKEKEMDRQPFIN